MCTSKYKYPLCSNSVEGTNRSVHYYYIAIQTVKSFVTSVRTTDCTYLMRQRRPPPPPYFVVSEHHVRPVMGDFLQQLTVVRQYTVYRQSNHVVGDLPLRTPACTCNPSDMLPDMRERAPVFSAVKKCLYLC